MRALSTSCCRSLPTGISSARTSSAIRRTCCGCTRSRSCVIWYFRPRIATSVTANSSALRLSVPWALRPRGDVMGNARRLAREALHALLDRTIRPREPPMLPQVIEPRIREPGLDDSLRVRRVLEHVPVVGTIAPAFARERYERSEELFAMLGCNVVLDRHQHRAGILIHTGG